jgi:nucleoside phosphorylase
MLQGLRHCPVGVDIVTPHSYLEEMPASEALLARIAFDPGSKLAELNPIPWPAGFAPTPVTSANQQATDPLPSADVLVVTYTAAEGRALADVLTPGVTSTKWNDYTKDFAQYLPKLGARAPARESKRLGSWHLTRIGQQNVICFKSELHPATDGPDVPILALWAQIIADAQPKLVITTGTAGGVGSGTELGDVAVARALRWDCQQQFKNKPWATSAYPTSPLSASAVTALRTTGPLMAANEDKIPSSYRTRPAQIWESETTVTTDFFAIGDTTDHYHLLSAAPDCRAVEMDDAALGLALMDAAQPPPFLSIRNASDPVMPGTESIAEQTKLASSIYERYGYYTTVNSAIACWAIITAL